MCSICAAESVCAGHPDTLADQIADQFLDDILYDDKAARVAVEVMAAGRRIIVAGEITTNHRPHIRESVRTTLARPGHRLVNAHSSVKLRQHAHVTCGLTQALIACPQRHAGGHDDARQERRVDSTEPPAPQPPLLDEVPDPLIVDIAKDHEAL